MPEMNQIAAGVAKEEVSRFSREAFDYEWPHQPGQERPGEILEWVRTERQRRKQRNKVLGTIMVAIVSTILTALVAPLVARIVSFIFP